MDCHITDTKTWKLLGYFKEPNYHEWMEQLFKHSGYCLWNNTEYSFMEDNFRSLWPCTCTNTGQSDPTTGKSLYYDTKPMPQGRIGLGLYTDSRCKNDFIVNDNDDIEGEDSIGIATVLKSMNDNSVYNLLQGLDQWNDAFDIFKQCQPCKSYNLGRGSSSSANTFDCYDDAGKYYCSSVFS